MDINRIKCEAIIINKIFAARNLSGVHVLDGGNGQPRFMATPNTIVYAINVPMRVDGSKLVKVQDDLGAYINAFYEQNGIVVRDSAGQMISPSVRVDRHWRKIEIQRPDPKALFYSKVGDWEPAPHKALLGVRFTGKKIVPVTWDLTSEKSVHGLVAGTTGSGKTNAVMTIMYSLAQHTPSSQLRFIVLDPKRSNDLAQMKALPHTETVAREYNEMVAALDNLYEEMEERERGNAPKDVRLVLVLEEAASLLDNSNSTIKSKANHKIEELGRRGRESNINLIVCTQRPTKAVIGPQLKSMLHVRIVGALLEKAEATNAIGTRDSGAEQLPGRGAMIYRLNNTMFRMQTPLIDDPQSLVADIASRQSRPTPIRDWCKGGRPKRRPQLSAPAAIGVEPEIETDDGGDDYERIMADAQKIKTLWQEDASMAAMLRAVSGNPNIHTGSAWWRGRVLDAIEWLKENAEKTKQANGKILKMRRKAG